MKKMIVSMFLALVAIFLSACSGGGSDSSSGGGDYSGGSSTYAGAGSFCAYNYPEEACTILCDEIATSNSGNCNWNSGSGSSACGSYSYDSEYDYGYSVADVGSVGACILSNMGGTSGGTNGGTGSYDWNLCTKITSTTASTRCSTGTCEVGFSFNSNYLTANSCESAATTWRETQSSGGAGNNGNTGGDVYIERGECFEVVYSERGQACENSLTVKWRNICGDTLDLQSCMERTDGSWGCGIQLNIRSGEISNSGSYVCHATGNYEWRGRSSESTASFPVDH